jgi:hypothetical protein
MVVERDSSEARAHFKGMIAHLRESPEELQAVVDLAAAQLAMEDLADRDERWRTVIQRPEGAASADVLRVILELARDAGSIRDETPPGPRCSPRGRT